MLRIFRAALIGVALSTATPAAAQTEGDPQTFAAARALLQAMDFDEQMRATTVHMTDRILTTMTEQIRAQEGRDLPPELMTEVRQIMQEHNAAVLAATAVTALDDAARIYARYFTLDELRELARVMTSPVMIKMQRVSPQFTAELAQIGMAEAIAALPELQRRLGEAMARWRLTQDRHGDAAAS